MFLLNILWATRLIHSSQTTVCDGIGYRMWSPYDPAVLYPLGIDGVDLRPKIAVKLAIHQTKALCLAVMPFALLACAIARENLPSNKEAA